MELKALNHDGAPTRRDGKSADDVAPPEEGLRPVCALAGAAVADTSERACIGHQILGPTSALHLRHVPSDWVFVGSSRGVDLVTSVDKLRRAAVRRGYEVDNGFTVKNGNPSDEGIINVAIDPSGQAN